MATHEVNVSLLCVSLIKNKSENADFGGTNYWFGSADSM